MACFQLCLPKALLFLLDDCNTPFMGGMKQHKLTSRESNPAVSTKPVQRRMQSADGSRSEVSNSQSVCYAATLSSQAPCWMRTIRPTGAEVSRYRKDFAINVPSSCRGNPSIGVLVRSLSSLPGEQKDLTAQASRAFRLSACSAQGQRDCVDLLSSSFCDLRSS
ncbi:hypothetical protein Neosp_011046 [[Neocosmospora] mangrovei]